SAVPSFQLGERGTESHEGLAAEFLERLGELARPIDFPILLRRQTNAGTVGTAALVGATEGGRRRSGG
ncbi:MAG: hypothetical protein H6Q48_1078, partial [Deltaproteobacteria bacterium]|nr:hypothetical protein [Deltaproteobacteria bacterium]